MQNKYSRGVCQGASLGALSALDLRGSASGVAAGSRPAPLSIQPAAPESTILLQPVISTAFCPPSDGKSYHAVAPEGAGGRLVYWATPANRKSGWGGEGPCG